jgi:hypothetical protein
MNMGYYMVYIIIGLGLGATASSIITSNSKKVQNAKDDLEAKKAWIMLLAERNKKQSLGVRR